MLTWDETAIAGYGFQQVRPIAQSVVWNTIKITCTSGQHGNGDILSQMGQVCGFLLQHEQEPSFYWAGDTVWCEAVKETIEQILPAIIVTHSCGAVWGKGGLIVMDAEQTVAVCQTASQSVVVATHMDSLDHATISRADLQAVAKAHNISSTQLLIPQDGGTLVFDGTEGPAFSSL